MIEALCYVTESGREPVTEWLQPLKDKRAQAKSEPVGDEVLELREHLGAMPGAFRPARADRRDPAVRRKHENPVVGHQDGRAVLGRLKTKAPTANSTSAICGQVKFPQGAIGAERLLLGMRRSGKAVGGLIESMALAAELDQNTAVARVIEDDRGERRIAGRQRRPNLFSRTKALERGRLTIWC